MAEPRYLLPEQKPRTNSPSLPAPVPSLPSYEHFLDQLNSLDFLRLLREARHIKKLYTDVSKSPEWRYVYEDLKDYEVILASLDDEVSKHFLNEVQKALR